MDMDYWTHLILYHLKDVSPTFQNRLVYRSPTKVKGHVIYLSLYTYEMYMDYGLVPLEYLQEYPWMS